MPLHEGVERPNIQNICTIFLRDLLNLLRPTFSLVYVQLDGTVASFETVTWFSSQFSAHFLLNQVFCDMAQSSCKNAFFSRGIFAAILDLFFFSSLPNIVECNSENGRGCQKKACCSTRALFVTGRCNYFCSVGFFPVL